jgi:poly(A) polymerase
VFPLRAADFMVRGIEKGPALGAAMHAAEQAWSEAGFPSEAAALELIAAAAAKQSRE